ncbi:hypothetical protein BVY04_01015 [bacterium M21]|nr:hypothetical protein BVY04_01015 [bacterium M21]
MSFAKAVSRTFISQVASAGMLLLVGILTARVLGPELRGMYSLFFTTVGFMLCFTGFGLSQANVYFLNQNESAGHLGGNSGLMIVIQSCILIASLLAGRYVFDFKFLASIDVVTFFLLCTCGVIVVSDFVISGIVLGSHEYGLYNNNLVMQAGFILTVTLVSFALPKDGFCAILLRVIAVAAVFLWFLFSAFRRIDLPDLSINYPLLGRQLRFGMKNFFQNLIGLLNYKMYLFLLDSFVNRSAVGIFSVALLFVEILRFIPNAVGTVLFPKLTTIDDESERSVLTARICRNTLFISVPILIGIAAMVTPVITFAFKKDYSGAVPIVCIMLPGALCGTLYQILTRYFSSRHQQHFSIISGISALLVAGTTSYLTIPIWGVKGAAIGFLCCNICLGLLMVVFFCAKTRLSPVKVLLIDSGDMQLLKSIIRERLKGPSS